MRVLIIGGTGFIGTHIVRRLADHAHVVAVYHRGRTQAVLPPHVHQILHPRSTLPIQTFPKKLFEFGPDVVIHTMAMGAADAEACVRGQALDDRATCHRRDLHAGESRRQRRGEPLGCQQLVECVGYLRNLRHFAMYNKVN